VVLASPVMMVVSDIGLSEAVLSPDIDARFILFATSASFIWIVSELFEVSTVPELVEPSPLPVLPTLISPALVLPPPDRFVLALLKMLPVVVAFPVFI
jgi:hypothetical protein